MKPMIRWTLWERKWSTFWWCVGLAAWVAVNLLVYSTVRDQAASLNQVVHNLPGGARTLLAGSGDITSPLGYLNAKLYSLFLPLLLGALAVGLGRWSIAHEERAGTLELLLSRPVSRSRFLAAKLLAAGGILFAVAFTTYLAIVICGAVESMGLPAGRVGAATALSLLFALLLGAVTFAATAASRHGSRFGTGLAVLIGLGGYLAASLQGYATWLRYLAKGLPYHYYDALSLLKGGYTWWHAAILLLATAVLIWFGFVRFQHRDIG